MWISNTATTLMLLPVALAVLQQADKDERRVGGTNAHLPSPIPSPRGSTKPASRADHCQRQLHSPGQDVATGKNAENLRLTHRSAKPSRRGVSQVKLAV
jgi:hypothetical protein